MEVDIKPQERIDDLECKGYKIIQDQKRFCFGIDAVLLSGFAKVRKGDKAVDLGTGTGIIPLLLHAKTEGKSYVALEIQEESADMARRSVMLNDLTDDIKVITGDIKDASSLLGTSSFNVVTCNPPYMIGQHGIQNEVDALTIARHEILCNFDDVAREASRLLKVKGRFYLIHRPFRLPELFETLKKYHLEPKTMRLVYPFVDKEPNMVLIECIKGAKERLNVEKPLIVYDAPGKYTDEIYKIYNMDR